MKVLKFKIVIILLLFLCNVSIFGQDKKNTSQNNSYFSVAINYISDAVFMGRKDSISAPYLYPSITYHHKSGFYTKGSLSYLTKSDEGRIDLYLLTAGIDFNVKNFYGDISATKYFFNDNSYTVLSQVEADITASLLYDFKIVNVSLAASSYFSNNNNTDFFLSSEISHDFITSDKSFQVSPTAGIYLGSQNFYEEYYIYNRFGSRSGQGHGSGSTTTIETTTEVVIQESENFDIMAIEFSLPMWYTNNSFTFSFLPTLAIPQNEATLAVDGEVFKEELDETFYWMVGINYKFN
ncbi:hypothetical protein [Lutibacter sp.]|uniref:hypothetical protein n=1 Tax=Lutibacter sp. TaxID=1925666 RepID=UPI003561A77A